MPFPGMNQTESSPVLPSIQVRQNRLVTSLHLPVTAAWQAGVGAAVIYCSSIIADNLVRKNPSEEMALLRISSKFVTASVLSYRRG